MRALNAYIKLMRASESVNAKLISELSTAKLTISQFFRPSGLSTQLVGVTPDIELSHPPARSGERIHDNALPPAQIDPALDPSATARLDPPILDLATAMAGSTLPAQPPDRLSLHAATRQAQLAGLDAGSEKAQASWLDLAVLVASQPAFAEISVPASELPDWGPVVFSTTGRSSRSVTSCSSSEMSAPARASSRFVSVIGSGAACCSRVVRRRSPRRLSSARRHVMRTIQPRNFSRSRSCRKR